MNSTTAQSKTSWAARLKTLFLYKLLPLAAIAGTIYGVTTYVLDDPGGRYIGICHGVGRFILDLDCRQGNTKISGALAMPSGTRLSIQEGTLKGNQIDLSFAGEPVRHNGDVALVPVVFHGKIEGSTLTGSLTRAQQQVGPISLQRTNASSLFERLWFGAR